MDRLSHKIKNNIVGRKGFFEYTSATDKWLTICRKSRRRDKIRGTREWKREKEEKGKTFHRVERSYGNFSQSVTLPCVVNESEIAAEFQNGVLAIKLPKAEESKAHKIKVKGGGIAVRAGAIGRH